MPSALAEKIIQMLSPSVGNFVAKHKVIAACNIAGLDVEKLDKSNLGPFLEKFEIGIRATLGPEVAKSLKAKVLEL
jgi:hypothetical protein